MSGNGTEKNPTPAGPIPVHPVQFILLLPVSEAVPADSTAWIVYISNRRDGSAEERWHQQSVRNARLSA